MLRKTVQGIISRYDLLRRGDRVVVAVSGGADSVCLLSILAELSADFDLSLHVAHLDHQFRGPESAGEARFVAGLARKLGLPATVDAVDVPAYCRDRGLSPQAGAREVRYDFLSRVARDTRATRIATGHTADDLAETFLLRLLRGAGVSGLSGIPPKRGIIIRPLLETTREDVLAYLQSRGLDFVTDSSNEKSVYTRNRIRKEVLPVLRQFNPRIVQTLASEAAILRDEAEAADAFLTALTAGVMEPCGNGIGLARKPFSALPRAIQRRLLLKAVDAAGGGSTALSFGQVDEALEFMARALSGRRLNLPSGLTIEREYERFLVRFPEEQASFSYPVRVPGITVIPELALVLQTVVADNGTNASPAEEQEVAARENYLWQALFDYDKIVGNITVRNRLPGDWFCPAGMRGDRKKIQDFFVDARIPRRRRNSIPLVLAGQDILWVAGLRRDERYLPGPDTKRLLVVQVKPQENPSAFQER